jgi:GNAT superfamily N-acetyltransferase
MTAMQPINPADAHHLRAFVDIWNAACGPDLAIDEHFVEYNLRFTQGCTREGRFALHEDRPAGFVIASAIASYATLTAIAVRPEAQRRGIGSALLSWAEEWLKAFGCAKVSFGAGTRIFAPGLPVELNDAGFFLKRGYVPDKEEPSVWDVAMDLADYPPPSRTVRALASGDELRPARPEDEAALMDFFKMTFPGSWKFEFMEHVREGGRMSDFMVLIVNGAIEGFCQLTFEVSLRPLNRFYPHRLPRPWGQLGAIGVSERVRGQGYGGAVLDAGLRRLRDAGVRGCIIDWTDLTEFYGKFGFKPYREYLMLWKPLV